MSSSRASSSARWADYEAALRALEHGGGDLLAALAPHAQWTSAATHAVLPLLASDDGVRLQVHTGIASHRARFGEGARRGAGWRGGFWLPECAHVARLEPLLAEAGVHATCVELTGRYGVGAAEHLQPRVGESGVVLVPIDRATIDLVWSERGYPAHGAYRDYHHHTIHHHTPWSNDGGAYDHAKALALARTHAADFVARTAARLRDAGADLPGGGLVVCALDTELLGHWWYEGVDWLAAVVEECSRQQLELVRLDDALERLEPEPTASAERESTPARSREPYRGRARARALDDRDAERASSWGANGDLSTWSGPAVADVAFALRRVELETLAARPRAGRAALRELLALQSSDWAFMLSRELAAPYARERMALHRAALERALRDRERFDERATRNIAAYV